METLSCVITVARRSRLGRTFKEKTQKLASMTERQRGLGKERNSNKTRENLPQFPIKKRRVKGRLGRVGNLKF